MMITERAYNELLWTCPLVPPETGGIIGGREGVVDICAFDNYGDNLRNRYIPNTIYLNEIICQWQNVGVKFYGMFHSHDQRGKELSEPDETYIRNILSVMPQSVSTLYFPLIFPRDRISGYSATKGSGGIIHIVREEVIIKM